MGGLPYPTQRILLRRGRRASWRRSHGRGGDAGGEGDTEGWNVESGEWRVESREQLVVDEEPLLVKLRADSVEGSLSTLELELS